MFSLYFISNVQDTEHEIILTLEDKKIVALPKTHQSYEYYSKLINRAFSRKHPIGLLISNDHQITAVRPADNDIVENIIRDKKILKVYFMGHNGIFRLDIDHPRFDVLYTNLNKSKINSQRVWFLAQLSDLILLDVKIDGEK